MGIFDRMGKVISSNVNALLDKLEDPAKIVALDLDEADEQLRRGRQEVVTAVASEKQLRNKVAALDGEIETWERRAELAVKAGDEALAREALKQKRRVVDERERVERARVEQREEALKLKDELDRADAKLKDWRMRKGTLAAKAQQAKAGGGVEALGARGPSTAFDDMRRIEDRIEGRAMEADAMAEVNDAIGKGPSAAELEAKFRDLEAKQGKGAGAGPDVEDELSALKKRLRV